MTLKDQFGCISYSHNQTVCSPMCMSIIGLTSRSTPINVGEEKKSIIMVSISEYEVAAEYRGFVM